MKTSKIILIALLLIIFALVVAAQCTENQINVNTASLEELDKLYGIGPSKAQNIINTRPFNSIDDLINVSGIGEIILDKIKSEGLACVGDLIVQENTTQEETNDTSIQEKTIPQNQTTLQTNHEENISTPFSEEEPSTIVLNAQNIKTQETTKKLRKNDYAKYGLIGFFILIAILFLIKKKKYKNEFKE